MWKCKVINGTLQVMDFLNENNIKPENCKITECYYDNDHDYYSVFYYVDSEG